MDGRFLIKHLEFTCAYAHILSFRRTSILWNYQRSNEININHHVIPAFSLGKFHKQIFSSKFGETLSTDNNNWHRKNLKKFRVFTKLNTVNHEYIDWSSVTQIASELLQNYFWINATLYITLVYPIPTQYTHMSHTLPKLRLIRFNYYRLLLMWRDGWKFAMRRKKWQWQMPLVQKLKIFNAAACHLPFTFSTLSFTRSSR